MNLAEQKMKQCNIISMINYKGGVAKTTSTFNLAAGLSFLGKKKVLVIDLDPQCSLTNICLKSYGRKINNHILDISSLDIDTTINHVFKQYLNQTVFRSEVSIDLDRVIFEKFYTDEYQWDFIPATMFDYTDSKYAKGLDDLQIDIAMHQFGEFTSIHHVTLLAKFIDDYDLENRYDYIIFDCPPANNITTQNALVVSDYILIPTIMDAMSTNGIVHLYNLINETIFGKLEDLYYRNKSPNLPSYFKFLEKGAPKLLGIFETLRKPQVNVELYVNEIMGNPQLRDHFFSDNVIHNIISTARNTGEGYSVFSEGIYKNQTSIKPKIEYAQVALEVLHRTQSEYDIEFMNSQLRKYMR
ncbi:MULTISPECIES: ParA family protein [Bacillus cereus group]|nr:MULTISPECIES: AAA family ATPase [Bacillus cereus group]NKW82825.1 AAA family ATPase [Bacillus cereus]